MSEKPSADLQREFLQCLARQEQLMTPLCQAEPILDSMRQLAYERGYEGRVITILCEYAKAVIRAHQLQEEMGKRPAVRVPGGRTDLDRITSSFDNLGLVYIRTTSDKGWCIEPSFGQLLFTPEGALLGMNDRNGQFVSAELFK